MLNNQKFKEGMALLCEIYQRPANDLFLKAYYQTLKDLTDEQFELAVGNVMSDKIFNKMPLPGEILEKVHGKAADKAVLACLTIEKATSKGPYCSIVFDDPFIHATIYALGGWEHVCDISAIPEEWKFFKRDIERTYAAMIGKSLPVDIPLRLSGYFERHNSAQGIDLNKHRPRVEYIGNLDKIREWRKRVKQLQGETKAISH